MTWKIIITILLAIFVTGPITMIVWHLTWGAWKRRRRRLVIQRRLAACTMQ